jgi:hypothetical protein
MNSPTGSPGVNAEPSGWQGVCTSCRRGRFLQVLHILRFVDLTGSHGLQPKSFIFRPDMMARGIGSSTPVYASSASQSFIGNTD